MSSPFAHLVDPEYASIVLAKNPRQMNLDEDNLLKARAMFANFLGPAPSLDGVNYRISHIPGPAGAPDVEVHLYSPATPQPGKTPAVLWFHGGGFCVGTPLTFDHATSIRWARDHGVLVVVPNYRKAPENPYPAAMDDSYAALKWLHTSSERLGIDSTRIIVGGKSAGGNIAICIALMARDRKEDLIHRLVMFYPMLDDRCVENRPDTAGPFDWSTSGMRFAYKSFLPDYPLGSSDVPAYALASRAKDLSGLPRSLIITGALDMFIEDILDFTKRLLRAGVMTDVHVMGGGPHGFDGVGAMSTNGKLSAQIVDSVIQRLFQM